MGRGEGGFRAARDFPLVNPVRMRVDLVPWWCFYKGIFNTALVGKGSTTFVAVTLDRLRASYYLLPNFLLMFFIVNLHLSYVL